MPKSKLTKRQKSEQRKRKAVIWLAEYTGDHVVRAYCRKFNVDLSCALRELEEIGYSISEEQKRNLLKSHAAQQKHKQQEREQALLEIADNIMLHEHTALDFCESDEEIIAVIQEVYETPPKQKKQKQGLPKNWKGHYCKVCKRHLANERFSGKGHKAHICKACASKLKAERKAKRKEQE